VVTRPSDTRLLVLHGLRLKGFAGVEDVAEVTSVTTADVNRHLDELQVDELVLYRDGRLTGWALTPAGRAEHERLLAEELDALGCRAVVEDAYGRFLELNPDLLTVCTAWQMKDESTMNAHDDEDYDRGVVHQLGDVHERIEPVLTDLRNALDRYQGYQPRFRNALVRVQDGDHDWFAKPMIDSYHTVWFQLHEDLLNTLGIERSKEAAHS
jgi:DNA-binding MarR family transcriptional regulator